MLKRSTYLIYLTLFILAVAAIVPAQADEPEPQWYPTATATNTPTATATFTPTATPTDIPLQACQVTAIQFLADFYTGEAQDSFSVNDTIRVRVSVADADGNPLGGANVDAEVTRQELGLESIQSASPVDLDDRSGDYDGVYDQTAEAGLYTFNFTVSDPTGERFLPCAGSASIEVQADDQNGGGNGPECEIAVTFDQTSYFVGDTITLTTTVTNTNSSTATLSGLVERPGGITDTLSLTGDGFAFTGSYSSTAVAGSYQFNLAAAAPTGENFSGCSVSEAVTVAERPDQPQVSIRPNPLDTTLCSLSDAMAFRIDDVIDLAVVEMDISYNPDIIQVIDANASQRGVQVRVNSVFSTDDIFLNEVDTRNGLIRFGAGVIGVPAVTGSSGLIAVDWRPQRVGSSAVTIERIRLLDVDGNPISASVMGSNTVNVNFVPNCLQGTVALEGRATHGGVIVTNGAGDQTQTLPDGSFGIPASESLDFDFPSYLAAGVNLQQALAAAQNNGDPIVLDPIAMAAGDTNGDNAINIFDLAYLAQHYLTTNPLADLNGDGIVNILDLALIAGNYQQAGPVISSQ